MKYKIAWIDATLTESYKDKAELIHMYADQGIKLTIDNESDWYDFTCTHEFSARNDQEAIEYTKKYKFGMRDVDIFSLMKDGKTIFTEEYL